MNVSVHALAAPFTKLYLLMAFLCDAWMARWLWCLLRGFLFTLITFMKYKTHVAPYNFADDQPNVIWQALKRSSRRTSQMRLPGMRYNAFSTEDGWSKLIDVKTTRGVSRSLDLPFKTCPAGESTAKVAGYAFERSKEQLRAPRVVRVGAIQHKIALSPSAPVKDQISAAHKKIGDIIDAAGACGVNVLCMQEAWSKYEGSSHILLSYALCILHERTCALVRVRGERGERSDHQVSFTSESLKFPSHPHFSMPRGMLWWSYHQSWSGITNSVRLFGTRLVGFTIVL